MSSRRVSEWVPPRPGDNLRVNPLRPAVLIAVFAAACIPTRDNLQDPQNRPIAVLTAVTVEGGRSTPFELDATASHDPRDPSAILHYAWELDDPIVDADVGADELDDFDDVPGDSGHIFQNFPKPFASGTNGEGVVVRTVRVRVSAADGASSVAEATIVVRNQRPIVDPGEDLYISNLRTAAIELDARGGGSEPTTIDPDGDTLFFTWTQLAGDPVVLDTSMDPVHKQRVRFVPPIAKRSLTFRVDGTDGMAGESGFLRVHRTKQAWMASRSPTRVYRVFPDFRSKTSLEDLQAPGTTTEFTNVVVIAVTPAGNVWTAERAGSDTLVRRLDPELRQSATFTVSGWAIPMWGDAEGEDLCLVVQSTSGVAARAFARVSPTGVVATPVPVPNASQTHATGTGDCWAVSASSIGRLHATGTVTTLVSGFDRIARSTVAEDGALWAAVSDPDGARDRIVRLAQGGVLEDVYVYAPAPASSQTVAFTDLAPRRGGGVWVHDSSRALTTLSAAGVLSPTDAPRMRLDPGTFPRRQFASDLSDGTIWLADSQSGDLIHLFDAGDTVRELGRTPIESLAPTAPLFLSPFVATDGSVLVTATGSGESWILRVPTHMKTNDRVDTSLVTVQVEFLSVDRVRGAAWIPDGSTFEARLLRVSPSGRVLAKLSGNIQRTVAQPDGQAWALSFDTGTAASRILYVSSTGGVLASVLPIGTEQFVAFDATPDDGCVVAVADPLSNSIDTTTFLLRFSRTATSPQILLTQLPGPQPISSCWIDRADGATWVVNSSSTCFGNVTGTSTVRRFAKGSTSPSLTLSSAQGIPFSCDVVGDEVSGVWMKQPGQMSRLGAMGPSGETIPGKGAVVPCGNGDPACRELWAVQAQTDLVRTDASGAILDTFRVPTSGRITSFHVVP